MRRSRQAMAESHTRILRAASDLFRARGLDDVRVADVMHAAGMTHGGFYRHFQSKEDLVAQAIDAAFAALLEGLAADFEALGPEQALANHVATYLDEAHVANPADGCPAAALAAEVARHPARVRAAMARGMDATAEQLAQAFAGPDARARADVLLALLMGSVVQARTLGPKARARLLAAARQAADALVAPARPRSDSLPERRLQRAR